MVRVIDTIAPEREMNCERGGTQFNSYDGAHNRYEEKYRPAVPAMPSRVNGRGRGSTSRSGEWQTATHAGCRSSSQRLPETGTQELSRKGIFSGTPCPAGRKRTRSVLGGHGPRPIPASAQPHL